MSDKKKWCIAAPSVANDMKTWKDSEGTFNVGLIDEYTLTLCNLFRFDCGNGCLDNSEVVVLP